ncbi:MAG: UbiX family flavin prenyltransferase [Gammaproteobacteria bacterium]|nr:UbiX family flavin prenyltransferase [Gammaproteobacteria bacterium]MXW46443.1 UbiX family flavin prenyltransferase [Gammaproteobacteria bacterium]MYD02114.1 UbiX family flavin prenyltransferase [Gammaproteobacteria bacterium]MYI24579.1 UbiX family flavin prenyltransferase [Gammaproteobacteria bacterium]
MRLIIGISGASGVIYGIRLLEALREAPEVETHLIISNGGKVNIALETGWKVRDVEALADVVYSDSDVAATIASGSFATGGMIVAPCSMKTLGAIVNSYAANLLVRAADVTLKEGRKLVLAPRETPLHAGHLRLMHEAARMGAVVAPPVPGFYAKPASVEDIVNHTVGRLMDLFGLETDLVRRWPGGKEAAKN